MSAFTLMPLGRRGLVQATNLVVTSLVASLAIIKIVILGLNSLPIPAFFVIVAGVINAIYIRRNGSIDVAAKILIITALFGLAFSSFYTGGVDASVVLFAPIIPIMTVLLINTRAAWITFGLVCLILIGIFILDFNGHIPENTVDPDLLLMSRYIVLICLCLISTWVVSRFSSISRTLLVQLEQQSNIDYLTGVLNRRAIETELLQEIDRAKRSNTWLSLIMADVDFFKLYNDSNGHLAGDTCLKEIAKLISDYSLRAADSVGRFGGEEFVLILPDTNMDKATEIAENLRKIILNQHIPYGPNNTDPVTLTLGVTSAYGQTISGTEQLIREADAALYKGKHQGRNRVVSSISGSSVAQN
ncbi:GGDEF domain-containing protein [Marinomonas colpomeniae]|uniref:diguanylate cyclase n=1 Tax=Marinomonas colpomeniae TaxID=2774408 RepID=A0ABR8NWS8_9GAMM|nr:GGDEF domain-containing protein [Marinomonas colpomeniae]MBD5769638.1 GGDEF domain-containing protein [Marinomonas colpomeniae]